MAEKRKRDEDECWSDDHEDSDIERHYFKSTVLTPITRVKSCCDLDTKTFRHTVFVVLDNAELMIPDLIRIVLSYITVPKFSKREINRSLKARKFTDRNTGMVAIYHGAHYNVDRPTCDHEFITWIRGCGWRCIENYKNY
jgi:hypothetical protein